MKLKPTASLIAALIAAARDHVTGSSKYRLSNQSLYDTDNVPCHVASGGVENDGILNSIGNRVSRRDPTIITSL